MATSAILLLAAGAIAALAYVIIAFLQFLVHGAICSGCFLSLVEINSVVPGEIGTFMMAALMAVIAISLFRAWQGWKAGLQRVGLA